MKEEAVSPQRVRVPLVGMYHEDAGLQDSLPKRLSEAPRSYRRESLEHALSIAAMLGDLLIIALGFLVALWLRMYSGFIPYLKGDLSLRPPADYAGLLVFGVLTVFAGLLAKNVYGPVRLRLPRRTGLAIAAVIGTGLFIFTGLVSVLKTEPRVPRLLVVCAFWLIFMGIIAWRVALSRVMRIPALARRLRRRLLIIGWNDEAMRIKQLAQREDSVYQYVGWIAMTDGSCGTQNSMHVGVARGFSTQNPESPLGVLEDTRHIIRENKIDQIVYADTEAVPTNILAIAQICEIEQVEFKLVPHFLEVLLSGLRPGKIGSVAVLGVEALPLNSIENFLLKRLVDIIGATVGLIVSAPLLLLFGALVWLESPGPILFSQERIGRRKHPFKMFKLRSMRPKAEQVDSHNQSTPRGDPRILRIGKVIRQWNIDETPQFWNVLKGDMSLVGPRPERTYHSKKLTYEIPHYQVRHSCPPGMTGWAQIQGLRGETSLIDRIREDIWYVENWSLWLDLKIMVMTFFKNSNAY